MTPESDEVHQHTMREFDRIDARLGLVLAFCLGAVAGVVLTWLCSTLFA